MYTIVGGFMLPSGKQFAYREGGLGGLGRKTRT